MCRSIKRLRTIDGVAGEDDIRAAARQYVRKVSGIREPVARNAASFESAVDAVTAASRALLAALPPSRASPAPSVRDGRGRTRTATPPAPG